MPFDVPQIVGATAQETAWAIAVTRDEYATADIPNGKTIAELAAMFPGVADRLDPRLPSEFISDANVIVALGTCDALDTTSTEIDIIAA